MNIITDVLTIIGLIGIFTVILLIIASIWG